MRWFRSISRVLACAVLTLNAAAPARADETRRILAEMGPWIAPCVQPTAGQRVFNACVDLHSSIHAHWAAYRMARYHPDFEPMAVASWTALEYEKLRHERPYINYRYARAWFLRLAIEYELWCTETGREDPQRLRPVAQDIAAQLFQFFQNNDPSPLQGEYQNPPWAMFQLWSWLEFVGNTADSDLVEQLVRTRYVRPMPTSFAADLGGAEFFSVAGNWMYLVARTQDTATLEQFLDMQPSLPRADLAVNGISATHGAGMSWSRTWALRALAERVADPELEELLLQSERAHVLTGLSEHFRRRGNFFGYDHWVPQFCIYAVTEGRVVDH